MVGHLTDECWVRNINTNSGKRVDGLLAQNTRQQEQIATLEASPSCTNKPKRLQAVDIEDRTDINVVFARFFQITVRNISYKSYAEILRLPTAALYNNLASPVVNASFPNLLKEFEISNWRTKKRPTLTKTHTRLCLELARCYID